MKEAREYVKNGITPKGLTQPVNDPDTGDTVAAASRNDQPPGEKETKSKASSSVVKLDLQKGETCCIYNYF